jgi:hypothetical protein
MLALDFLPGIGNLPAHNLPTQNLPWNRSKQFLFLSHSHVTQAATDISGTFLLCRFSQPHHLAVGAAEAETCHLKATMSDLMISYLRHIIPQDGRGHEQLA